MRHSLVAALSPTPQGGAVHSLIPSSPMRMTFHRNRLERASSSVGHVTAAGLTTWRRGPKRHSSDTESGKKGLGMGMEGTPGRRKKARSTSKVGYRLNGLHGEMKWDSWGVEFRAPIHAETVE